jgi:hypothetical protein
MPGGSRSNPQRNFSASYYAIFAVGALSILLGALAEAGVALLQQFVYGISSIISGIVFLVLGFLVKKFRSRIALGIAIAIYALDAIFFLQRVAMQHTSSISGAIVMRGFFLFYMFRGFAAIAALNESEEVVPATESDAVMPISAAAASSSAKSSSNLHAVSFVAPSLSAPSTTPAAAVVDKRPKPIASEFAASVLRHLVYRCEISDHGLRAIYSSGKQKEYVWTDFGEMIIRQLPSDPPWQGKILLDLIPISIKRSSGPIRLFSTTYVNYSFLPQGQSPSSQENIRRFGLFLMQHNPSLGVEPWTSQFLQAGKSPLRFANLTQFADYEARYS